RVCGEGRFRGVRRSPGGVRRRCARRIQHRNPSSRSPPLPRGVAVLLRGDLASRAIRSRRAHGAPGPTTTGRESQMSTHALADHARDMENPTTTLHPRAPMTLEEPALSLDLMMQLLLKLLHYSGELSGIEIAQRLGLEFPVVEPAIDFIKRLHQCEIVGGAGIGGPSYRHQIPAPGRQRAMLFMESSQYVGVAPVPLKQYVAYLEAYRKAMPRAITRSRVREAFSHLVLSERVLDQVGSSIRAAHSMFVYGPPGNGKTVIAQAIRNLLDGELAVPHAIEVEGSIIRLYDPVNREPIAK